ncbi:MAG: TetR/AcrR family transcriptional regulator [Hyphomonadaceae bacterium]
MARAKTEEVKRTRDAQATQRALLEAGARLFAEAGYDGATLERLAAGAGVTKAMVRYHFKDKAGLYRAVLLETFDHVFAAVSPVREAALAPKAKLERYVAALMEAVRARPHIQGLLIRDYAAGRIVKDKALLASLMRLSQTTAAILEEGRKAGAFRALDAHIYHLWLVGAGAFFVSSEPFRADLGKRRMWAGEPTFESFVRLLQTLAVKGAEK